MDGYDLTTALRLARHRCVHGPAGGPDDPFGVDFPIEELSQLLNALHKIGDRAAVVRVADRLVRVSAGIDQEAESAREDLVAVVRVLAWVGQVDQAEQIIAGVADRWIQAETQSILTGVHSSIGDFRRAELAADAITDADLRSNALIDLMWSLAEAGDRAGALRVAQRAEESIAAENSWDQSRKLNHLAQMLVSGGYVDEARGVAGRTEEFAATLSDPHDGGWARSSAVVALAFTGQFDRAEQLVSSITEESQRDSALFHLAGKVGEAGDFDRGLRLAGGITHLGSRSGAQKRLAGWMATAGDLERATSVTSAIASPSERCSALDDLGSALAAAGDRAGARRMFQEAEHVRATFEDPAGRRWARGWQVETIIDAGDFEQAERIALTVIEDYDPFHDLDRLARAMADAGDLAGARRVVDLAEPFAIAETGPDSRAWCLDSLAAVLILAGDADQARRLLVEATGSGAWYRTLSTVATLDPDAVRALAEDVLRT